MGNFFEKHLAAFDLAVVSLIIYKIVSLKSYFEHRYTFLFFLNLSFSQKIYPFSNKNKFSIHVLYITVVRSLICIIIIIEISEIDISVTIKSAESAFSF